MFKLITIYTACGEEVFARDKEGYETWVYSCDTCEEAENMADVLQKKVLDYEALREQIVHQSTRNFQNH